MSFKLKYRLMQKVDSILLNRKVMIIVALLAPAMFSVSALYLGGYFDNLTIPLPSSFMTKQFDTAKEVVSASTEQEKPSVFEDIINQFTEKL
jgi:hypothetical protein